jgi:quercetin dioxygenase-like cupin family protein
MWVVLKTYAADGENGLHAHPSEDHTFVVLQGEAPFMGRTTRPEQSARTWA